MVFVTPSNAIPASNILKRGWVFNRRENSATLRLAISFSSFELLSKPETIDLWNVFWPLYRNGSVLEVRFECETSAAESGHYEVFLGAIIGISCVWIM